MQREQLKDEERIKRSRRVKASHEEGDTGDSEVDVQRRSEKTTSRDKRSTGPRG